MDEATFRVYLRALEPEDYRITHAWRSDPDYQAGILSTKRFIAADTERRWIEQAIKEHEETRTLRFAVVLKETEELIGMAMLTDIDLVNRNAGGGTVIGSREHRGKGYATEARYLVLKHAFLELGLERVSSVRLENNVSSQSVAEKTGYSQEGILRNALFKGGRFHNLVVSSILKDEFYEKYGMSWLP